MKLLNVYRSKPCDDVKKLVEIVSEGTEASSFDLNVDAPDYDKLVNMVMDADKTICWW
ncbi:MAG: hypothetical protein OEV64_01030 [Desulfobulbaceae bacterium]|nr:hypothetical protein [Desulfobulbaceae bacterium]